MLQVKVFDEEHEDDLTQEINDFLNHHATIEVQDIKFSTAISVLDEANQIYCFSAMVIYWDKEIE